MGAKDSHKTACYATLSVTHGQGVTGGAERPSGGATNPGCKGRHDWFVTRGVTWGGAGGGHTTSPHPVLLGSNDVMCLAPIIG